MKGAIIASTYAITQQGRLGPEERSRPGGRHIEFPTDYCEGVHNAAIILKNYRDFDLNFDSADWAKGPPRESLRHELRGYETIWFPDRAHDQKKTRLPDAVEQPGIWLSIVGNDELWPLGHRSIESAAERLFELNATRVLSSALQPPPACPPKEPDPSKELRELLNYTFSTWPDHDVDRSGAPNAEFSRLNAERSDPGPPLRTHLNAFDRTLFCIVLLFGAYEVIRHAQKKSFWFQFQELQQRRQDDGDHLWSNTRPAAAVISFVLQATAVLAVVTFATWLSAVRISDEIHQLPQTASLIWRLLPATVVFFELAGVGWLNQLEKVSGLLQRMTIRLLIAGAACLGALFWSLYHIDEADRNALNSILLVADLMIFVLGCLVTAGIVRFLTWEMLAGPISEWRDRIAKCIAVDFTRWWRKQSKNRVDFTRWWRKQITKLVVFFTRWRQKQSAKWIAVRFTRWWRRHLIAVIFPHWWRKQVRKLVAVILDINWITALVAVAIALVFCVAGDEVLSDAKPDWVFFFERCAHSLNGVSLWSAFLFLAGAFYLLAYQREQGLLLDKDGPPPKPPWPDLREDAIESHSLIKNLTTPFDDSRQALSELLCQPIPGLLKDHSGSLWVLAAVIALWSAMLLTKIDPWMYDSWVSAVYWIVLSLFFWVWVFWLYSIVTYLKELERLFDRITTLPLLDSFMRLPDTLAPYFGRVLFRIQRLRTDDRRIAITYLNAMKERKDPIGNAVASLFAKTNWDRAFADELREGNTRACRNALNEVARELWAKTLVDEWQKLSPARAFAISGAGEPEENTVSEQSTVKSVTAESTTGIKKIESHTNESKVDAISKTPKVDSLVLANDFILIQLISYCNPLLRHAWTSCWCVAVSTLFLLMAIASYGAQPQGFFGTTAVGMIILLGVLTGFLVWRTERSELLSRFSGTTPGRVQFDWSFAIQVIVLFLIPVLVLINYAFPGAFDWLSTLLSPLFHVMK